MSLVQRLGKYYHKNGISALDFNCPHYYECKAEHRPFVKATEAMIGRYYEGTHPRLLFLSADPGAASRWKAERHMVALRTNFEGFRPKGNKYPHWYFTLQFAVKLLRPFVKGIDDACFEEVVKYIAHTNSAKCCQNKPGRTQADDLLFKNCREFIPGELKILEPDVIVTQGDKAKEVLETHEEVHEGIPGMRKPSRTKIVMIAGHKVLWIHTYHPAQKRSLFKRVNWPKAERYSRLLEGFLQSRT
jgi:hypothetical protein